MSSNGADEDRGPPLSSPPDRHHSIASSNSSNAEQSKERATVPSACVQCRSKHLKCDGLTPCSRCVLNRFDCVYVRSRRGYKGPRKNGTQSNKTPVIAMLNALPASTPIQCPLINPALAAPGASPHGLPSPPESRFQSHELRLFDAPPEVLIPDRQAGFDIRERCLEAFYYHFFPTHPFCLLRASFFALRKSRSLESLEAAMRYVGSFYIAQAPTSSFAVEAEQFLTHVDCPKDGFKVQAMLVLALGLDGFAYQDKALRYSLEAQELALELGMNKRAYATMNGDGSKILEESWRRTWWELYVVDGMIAGVHQKSSFRMKDVIADVALPCEEREYLSGNIPPPLTIQDFDDESFDGRNFVYSSYAYRIAAIRNLGRLLASRQIMLPDEATVERIDAHLVNWKLHLPESKKSLINGDGHVDEMLFQAHMIINATTIVLHRELSELDSSVAQHVTSCAPHKPIIPGASYNVHAARTIQAAREISKLVTLPIPLVKHTHFFGCVVTLASIVHLSCWAALMPLTHDDDLKQQLRLNSGALKSLWQVWPSAGNAFRQVKGVAQEIYQAKKDAAERGFWGVLTDDDVMRSMIEDQRIIAEFQMIEGSSDGVV